MPLPNFHSARLADPGKFDSFGYTEGGIIYGSIHVPESIKIVWGHPKGGPRQAALPQALRFPVEKWAPEQAKKWLADNNVKYISFEEAKKAEAMTAEDWADPDINALIPR